MQARKLGIAIIVLIGLVTASFVIAEMKDGLNVENADAATLGGTTLYVGGSGPNNYTKIQDAVDNASSGDTVFVYNGDYIEEIALYKTLVVEGENSMGTAVFGGFNVSADNVVIRNFSITEGFSLYSGRLVTGIYLTSSNNVLNNNHIWNISGKKRDFTLKGGIGTGIYLNGSSQCNISNNVLSNITGGEGGEATWDIEGGIGGIGTGIYLNGSSQCNISNNVLSNITGGEGGEGHWYSRAGKGGIGSGIYIQRSSYIHSFSNTISFLSGGKGGEGYDKVDDVNGGIGGIGCGYYLGSTISSEISDNTILYIRGGDGETIWGDGSGGAGGIGCGVYLKNSSTNEINYNHISFIDGGDGGESGYCCESGGAGGIGCGVYLKNSVLNFFISNTISLVYGGEGGTGSTLGADQVGFGIYFNNDSLNNDINSSNTVNGDSVIYCYNKKNITIENYVLTANSNPTNFGKIVLINCNNITVCNNTISNFTGGSGDTGKVSKKDSYAAGLRGIGENGSIGSSIYLKNSNHCRIENNILFNITGGTGGTGDRGRTGGNGGIGCGIFVDNSTLNILMNNSIHSNKGGRGGNGGHSKKDGIGGDWMWYILT